MKVVIVGAGPAGIVAAEALRAADPAIELEMITREAYPPYSPPALADYALSGRSDALFWKGTDVCDRLGIAYRSPAVVAGLDPERHRLALADGSTVDYDSLLIYVSDHGESLGEKGLYLHAAPYFMAPREQTHVPLLLWMSDGYRQRAGIDESCLRQRASRPASHDDLYHTVLGALGLRSAAYDPAHDLLGGCRSHW